MLKDSVLGKCVLTALFLAVACSDNSSGDGYSGRGGTDPGTGAASGAGGTDPGTGATSGTGGTDPGTGGTDPGTGGTDTGTGGTKPDGDGDPPPPVCTPPIELYDTSSPTAVIGDGTPESCTEADLRTAATAGGAITFDCGSDPVTIEITQTIELPRDRDTIIDGNGLVTLDAGHRTRHFYFYHPDWMNNMNRVVLQRLTFVNGEAPAGEFFPQDPGNPECAWGYKEGSGGAIFIRNGVLHVIDCEFRDNHAALVGPDVGGGAIYVNGVPEVIIVGSRFINNRAANGGAVAMLWANPQVYNSHFENNTAEGVGQNYVEPGCPGVGHADQGGAGGNSGAMYFDGMNDDGTVYTICGCVFRNNRANELGGALFRTPNRAMREMVIENCLFDANTGRMGGVSFIKENDVTVRGTTFMNNRSGVDIEGVEVGGPLGGLWINQGSVDIENSTFFNNHPTGLDVEGGSGGALRNVTLADSEPRGGLALNNCLIFDTSCREDLSGANNLQWPEGTACAGGTTFGDPEVGEIGDNGGPTPTIMPAAGGAAVGVGVDCPSVDQRGQPRNPASCTAGAVEP